MTPDQYHLWYASRFTSPAFFFDTTRAGAVLDSNSFLYVKERNGNIKANHKSSLGILRQGPTLALNPSAKLHPCCIRFSRLARALSFSTGVSSSPMMRKLVENHKIIDRVTQITSFPGVILYLVLRDSFWRWAMASSPCSFRSQSTCSRSGRHPDSGSPFWAATLVV